MYLTPDDSNTVKKWYLNKIKSTFGGSENVDELFANKYSIYVEALYNNKKIKANIVFGMSKKYTEVVVGYLFE